ncbi:hypothetical protein [Marinobacterium jannaschii]|uniref:hypothetical protein n=1 Tax=Marinobacterium jannaschii TaxID=64970 RepID=UPI000480F3AC|nr:hypothetical protein [Marinobacterium jannaschii]
MSGLHWFILAVVVMAALAYWNWQRSQDQLAQLQKQGFQISEDLKGQPRLLLDLAAKQVALVTPSQASRVAFADIVAAEYGYDSGTQTDSRFRIELSTSSGQQWQVLYENEAIARRQLERLNSLLGR